MSALRKGRAAMERGVTLGRYRVLPPSFDLDIRLVFLALPKRLLGWCRLWYMIIDIQDVIVVVYLCMVSLRVWSIRKGTLLGFNFQTKTFPTKPIPSPKTSPKKCHLTTDLVVSACQAPALLVVFFVSTPLEASWNGPARPARQHELPRRRGVVWGLRCQDHGQKLRLGEMRWRWYFLKDLFYICQDWVLLLLGLLQFFCSWIFPVVGIS